MRDSGRRTPWKCGIGALLLALPLAAQSPWSLRADLGVRQDTNPGNAVDEDDIVSVTGTFGALSLSNAYFLTDTLSLRVAGRVRGETFNRVEGLNNASIGLDGALHKKWGVGSLAPWTELGLSTARETFRESVRNAWRHHAALRAGKRVAEWCDLGVEAWAERRVAATATPEEPDLSGDAFSQSSHGYSLKAEFSLFPSCFFTLAYLYRQGDVTVNSPDEADEYPNAKAAALDPTFGPDFFAYKFSGTNHGGKADLSYAFTSKAALSLSFERQVTNVDQGETYSRNLSALTFTYRF